MKFIQKLKKDKSFRLKVILIFTALVLMVGNSPDDNKKEAEQSNCNLANKQTTGTFCDFDGNNQVAYSQIGSDICMRRDIATSTSDVNIEDYNLCLSTSCYIGRGEEIWGVDTYGCFSCVPGGLWVTDSGVCCGGRIEGSGPGSYNWLCRTEDPGGRCTNSFQQGVADFVNSIWPNNPFGSCVTKFYIVAFGGGTIIFILLMVAM